MPLCWAMASLLLRQPQIAVPMTPLHGLCQGLLELPQRLQRVCAIGRPEQTAARAVAEQAMPPQLLPVLLAHAWRQEAGGATGDEDLVNKLQ